MSFNAAWTGHSGNRFTLLPQVWESPEFGARFTNDASPLKTGINNYRLPFYHRLDLSLTMRKRHGYWTIGLFNSYYGGKNETCKGWEDGRGRDAQ